MARVQQFLVPLGDRNVFRARAQVLPDRLHNLKFFVQRELADFGDARTGQTMPQGRAGRNSHSCLGSSRKNQYSQYSQWSICHAAPIMRKPPEYDCDTIRRIQNATSDVQKCPDAGVEGRGSGAEYRVSRERSSTPRRSTLAPRPLHVRLLIGAGLKPFPAVLSNFNQL